MRDSLRGASPVITLGYLSLADVGPLDIIEAAGASGFRSVGLRLTSRRPSEPWPYAAISFASSRHALGRALAASGTALSNVSTFHLWPETTLEHLKPVIDASAELGAKTLIACVYRDLDASLVEFMGRYAQAANEAGLRIAVETVSYSACSTLRAALALLRQVNSPVLGLMLDPLHLQRGGSGLDEVKGLSPAEVCIAQLCDASAKAPPDVDAATEARTMRGYPGEGELPLREFLAAIPASTEIELEVPALEHRHLSAPDRAKLIRERCLAYLAASGTAVQ